MEGIKKIILGFCLMAMGLCIARYVVRFFPDGKSMTMVFCDVGQGDATYLRFPNGQDMLIDGGPDGSLLTCLGKYMPFWDRSIDLLLLTHPELDHFGGFIHVLSRYHVGTILRTNVEQSTPEYQEFLYLIKKAAIPEQFPVQGDMLDVLKVHMEWIWPNNVWLYEKSETTERSVLDIKERNDTSQVVHIRYGSFDALLTGDATISVAKQYAGIPLGDDDIEVIKVPHHGSQNGLDREYLEWAKPEMAIISCGRKNSYGHPHANILSLLNEFGVKVFRTDKDDTIVVKTDGVRYWKE